MCDGNLPMSTLVTSIAACFSPQEFIIEVLAPLGLTALRDWAPPMEGSPSVHWFDDVLSLCIRRGHLEKTGLWDALQRARPHRCQEFHSHRRSYVPRVDERPLPRVREIDALAETLVLLSDPKPLREFLQSLGWTVALPRSQNTLGLAHWALVALLRERRASTLFNLASALRSWRSEGEAVAPTAERLALCACDDEVPRTLRVSWLNVEREDDHVRASFHSWDPPGDRELTFDVADSDYAGQVADGLTVQVSLRANSNAVQLQLRASSESSWIGGTLRLCSGVRAVVRRLFPERGDRLGPHCGSVVLVEPLILADVHQ